MIQSPVRSLMVISEGAAIVRGELVGIELVLRASDAFGVAGVVAKGRGSGVKTRPGDNDDQGGMSVGEIRN
jgi:hypothetical protein